MEAKNMLTGLIERVSGSREDRPTAGTKYRLMGLVADIAAVAQTLQTEVLARVSQEAVIDADIDVDYGLLSEQILLMELPETGDDAVCEQTALVNDALGGLSSVLGQIADQLERRHKDEEYERLYEQEKRRFLSSGTPRRIRQTFDEWLYDVCDGRPSLEDINDYITEKLLKMFEKGVFCAEVEHIQRAKRYPDEFDFSQLDDDHKLKSNIHKHYAALRKLVDYSDGLLTVNAAHAGRHFFLFRHEENAKSRRNAFLKYMYKIDMAQQVHRKLQETESAQQEKPVSKLNYFAPTKHLKVLLTEEWFGMLTTDEKRFTPQWIMGFVDALMTSEWRDQIATDWAVMDKRLCLKCMIIGVLKDVGVVRGSYNSIAKLLDMDYENPATLAKYMGMGKKQPFAEWITNYVNP